MRHGDTTSQVGDLLVELGYLTAERLAQAKAANAGQAEPLDGFLVRAGYAKREAVIHARCIERGIAVVSFDSRADPVSPEAEAIALLSADLALRYQVLPLHFTDGSLEVAMADPFDLAAIDDLRMISGKDIVPKMAVASELAEEIRRHYGTSAARMAESLAAPSHTPDADSLNGDSVGHLHELAREPSLVNLVNLVVLEAVQDRASDIHIEPFEHQLKVKYRIDGILHEMPPPPKHLQAAIISRVKIMAGMNIAERFVPQDGHIEFHSPAGRVDMRVSTVPTVFGESVVMRILDKSATLMKLEQLGMRGAMLERFERQLLRPHGIIFVTGPTGSGKTTTLYAALNHIYTPEKKMITIEEPVEFHLEGINQMPVNPKRGLTFATGLRHIVRQDPDIIMVGEVRDRETADIAIRSALTGHLVFSTLHTNDAPSSVNRLLDMGVEPFLLSTTCEAMVAQRLVRIICKHCRQVDRPLPTSLLRLGNSIDPAVVTFYRGKGCSECHNTGYRGRTGIFELLIPNERIRELMMNRPTAGQVRAAAEHFAPMRADGCAKVVDGITTVDEVLRATEDTEEE